MGGLVSPLALCCAISMLCAGHGAEIPAFHTQPGQFLPIGWHTWRKLAGRWPQLRLTTSSRQQKPVRPGSLRTSADSKTAAASPGAASHGGAIPGIEAATDAVRRATAHDILAVLSGAALKRRSWVR